MAGRRWADLSPRARVGIVGLGAVQVSLTVTAWTDLSRRPAREVNGPKAVWAVVVALNTVGPVAYFRWGRRR